MALAKQYEQLVEKHCCTEAEYFEIERTTEGRWEYVNGYIRLMAGGSDDHAMISSNIGRLLGTALVARGCRVYVDDMKLHMARRLLGVSQNRGPGEGNRPLA